jgi:hypothetical protein
VLCATVIQIVAVSDLTALKSIAMPDDVRALLASHQVTDPETPG